MIYEYILLLGIAVVAVFFHVAQMRDRQSTIDWLKECLQRRDAHVERMEKSTATLRADLYRALNELHELHELYAEEIRADNARLAVQAIKDEADAQAIAEHINTRP